MLCVDTPTFTVTELDYGQIFLYIIGCGKRRILHLFTIKILICNHYSSFISVFKNSHKLIYHILLVNQIQINYLKFFAYVLFSLEYQNIITYSKDVRPYYSLG